MEIRTPFNEGDPGYKMALYHFKNLYRMDYWNDDPEGMVMYRSEKLVTDRVAGSGATPAFPPTDFFNIIYDGKYIIEKLRWTYNRINNYISAQIK